MSEMILSAKDIHFSLKKRKLLEQINFDVPKGIVFAVVGHNGAGKTTLFHLVLGLKFQNKGEITLLGKSNFDPESRAKLGYVPERPYLNLEYSFRSFLSYHANLLAIPRVKRSSEITKVALAVGLDSHLKQALSTFSKGMLQKALVAQALLGDPEVLILDEPMSGLDPDSREGVRKLIIQLKKSGKTLIFSSHALDDVEQLADQVLILEKGKVEFLGSVSEWKAKR
jgi:ABC-2 type transport system ATP-binding protein